MSAAVIRIGDWSSMMPALKSIRHRVFIVEQGIPEALEWDEHDAVSTHALALIDGQPAGCARLLPDGHIGRMAVLPALRGKGVGAALLQGLIACARERAMHTVQLHAQVHALAFYEKAGFVAEGEDFDEVGIRHRRMSMTLDS